MCDETVVDEEFMEYCMPWSVEEEVLTTSSL
jgi:hypothetical protein